MAFSVVLGIIMPLSEVIPRKVLTLSEVIPWKALILLKRFIIFQALSLRLKPDIFVFLVLFTTLSAILFQTKSFLQLSLPPSPLSDHLFHLPFHFSVPPSDLVFPLCPIFLLMFSRHSSSPGFPRPGCLPF